MPPTGCPPAPPPTSSLCSPAKGTFFTQYLDPMATFSRIWGGYQEPVRPSGHGPPFTLVSHSLCLSHMTSTLYLQGTSRIPVQTDLFSTLTVLLGGGGVGRALSHTAQLHSDSPPTPWRSSSPPPGSRLWHPNPPYPILPSPCSSRRLPAAPGIPPGTMVAC